MAAVPEIGRADRIAPRPGADATSVLYGRYGQKIFTYCLHQLRSREEAEDATQTTFMNAFRGLSRGIVPVSEQAWLFKIAENVCLARRKSSWRRGRIESASDFEMVQDLTPAPPRDRADELIGLQDALEAMPESQRRAILLREWQGLSYREIAEELELSQAAVETLIFRARRTLATCLEAPAKQSRKRRLSGLTLGANLASLIATIKGFLTGAAAVKAVAVTVAASSATVAATQTERFVHREAPPKPAVVAPVKKAKPAPPVVTPAVTFSGGEVATRLQPEAPSTGAAKRAKGKLRASRGGPTVGFEAVPHEPAAPAAAVSETPAPTASDPAPAASDPAPPAPAPAATPSQTHHAAPARQSAPAPADQPKESPKRDREHGSSAPAASQAPSSESSSPKSGKGDDERGESRTESPKTQGTPTTSQTSSSESQAPKRGKRDDDRDESRTESPKAGARENESKGRTSVVTQLVQGRKGGDREDREEGRDRDQGRSEEKRQPESTQPAPETVSGIQVLPDTTPSSDEGESRRGRSEEKRDSKHDSDRGRSNDGDESKRGRSEDRKREDPPPAADVPAPFVAPPSPPQADSAPLAGVTASVAPAPEPEDEERDGRRKRDREDGDRDRGDRDRGERGDRGDRDDD